MQWQGVSGGFEAFEPLKESNPSVLTTRMEYGARDILPSRAGASYMNREMDVGRPRKTWRTEQPFENISTLGGCLRPLWETHTHVKERKTALQSQQDPLTHSEHVPVQVFDRMVPPVMEKPHMSQRNPVEMSYSVPQFSGYGARFALPTEYVERPSGR